MKPVVLTDVIRERQGMADHDGQYWQNGNTIRDVWASLENADQATPWVVRLSSPGWIPINHMVYGSSESEALARLTSTLEYCAKHQYESGYPRSDIKIWQDFRKARLVARVEPYNKLTIAHLEWSARGF